MVTHATPRDVLVTRQVNYTIMRQLSHKLPSFVKRSVPIHSEKSECGLKEVTQSFSRDAFDSIMTFLQEVTRLSCDNGCWQGKLLVASQNCLPDILQWEF